MATHLNRGITIIPAAKDKNNQHDYESSWSQKAILDTLENDNPFQIIGYTDNNGLFQMTRIFGGVEFRNATVVDGVNYLDKVKEIIPLLKDCIIQDTLGYEGCDYTTLFYTVKDGVESEPIISFDDVDAMHSNIGAMPGENVYEVFEAYQKDREKQMKKWEEERKNNPREEDDDLPF